MMDWALANVGLIHRMPSFNDGITADGTVEWMDPTFLAIILPGGNPHYGLPAPAAPAVAPAAPAPVPAVDPAIVTKAIEGVMASMEANLQANADILLRAEWNQVTTIVLAVVVINPNDTNTVNPASKLYPWRGPGMEEPLSYTVERKNFTAFSQVVSHAANGRKIREVIIALSNFEEESGWLPLRHMGISDVIHLNRWAAGMDPELRRHCCDGGAVWVQVILRAHQPAPPPAPPPRTPTSSGATW
jgi:hypothetical protein